MAHIIFIVPPLTGHINPSVSLGQSLIDAGHKVAWIGYQDSLRRSLPSEYTIHPLGSDMDVEQLGTLHQGRDKRGLAAFQFLWEGVLIPLALQSYQEVYHYLELLNPDLCIVDQQTLAGALACQQLNIPWFTSASTSAALVDALAPLPKVKAWYESQVHQLLLDLNLPIVKDVTQIELSPYAVLIFSSRQLCQTSTIDIDFPEHFYFVGPAIQAQRTKIDFPWEKLKAKQTKIFISLGTVNAEKGARFYQVVTKALANTNYQVIMVAPSSLVTDYPSNFIIQDRVPQLALLPYMDLVICHGGHNTTCETLAHGIPLLIAPIKDDQPIIAQQVVASEAGLRIRFGRIKANKLNTYVKKVLREKHYRNAAQKIQNEFTRLQEQQIALKLIQEFIDKRSQKDA
jgi:MGT family glycosyltransferase